MLFSFDPVTSSLGCSNQPNYGRPALGVEVVDWEGRAVASAGSSLPVLRGFRDPKVSNLAQIYVSYYLNPGQE